MKYVAYCRNCGMITGHQVNGLTSNCMKCKIPHKTPIARWIAGIITIAFISFLIFWISITATLAALHP